MGQCLICAARVEPFMLFGAMPIANGFLRAEDFANERFFDLEVGFCQQCKMVQLTRLVDPSELFHESYAYFSSTSARMVDHFRSFAEHVRGEYLREPDQFVVEIGSNDGIMLGNFARWRMQHLGVEPSANVAQAAVQKGANTLCRFFNEETASEIRGDYGPADAVLGANVICHIPGIHSVVRGVDTLLKDKGVFVFEEPYLGDIIEKTSYDQIYDEHVFYFSISSLAHLFAQYDMEIIDALPQWVHGGSMRYVVARKGALPVKAMVGDLANREATLGLADASTFSTFKDAVSRSGDRLRELLGDLKAQAKRIVGYGATSKSTTVTNFCGIGPDLVEFVSDTTPTKQGKYTPGMHIPVFPYERFTDNYPEYALLFAWNHGEEIMAKELRFLENGGRFITYVPSVRVLDA